MEYINPFIVGCALVTVLYILFFYCILRVSETPRSNNKSSGAQKEKKKKDAKKKKQEQIQSKSKPSSKHVNLGLAEIKENIETRGEELLQKTEVNITNEKMEDREMKDTLAMPDQVVVQPKIEIKTFGDVKLSAGSMLNFDVGITGEPFPTVTWSVSGQPLRPSNSAVIDTTEESSKLVIRSVQTSDTGEYTVMAVNSSGRDSLTVSVTVVDKPLPPEGPLNVSDVTREGCKLKWKRPIDDGGTPVQYYQVEKMDPTTGLRLPCGRTQEPSIEVTGLTPGKEYKFCVSAVNEEGESEPLETAQAVLAKNPFDEPDKPKDVIPIDWDKDHVVLKWTPPENDGGSPITEYIIDKKDKYGNWEKAAELPADATTAHVPDLLEGKAYKFRVKAVNAAGPGEPSDVTQPIVAKARNMPPKIDCTNLIPVRIKAKQPFSYDVNVTGEPAPTIKWTLRGKDVKAGNWTELAIEEYNTRLNVRFAKRADAGNYTITAENKNGKDSADVEVIVLDIPSPPVGPLEVSDVCAEKCKLNFNPPADDGGSPVDHYIVEKCDAAWIRWTHVGKTEGSKPTMEVDGLQPGHKYKFRVKAVNEQGKSDPLSTSQVIETPPYDEPGKPGIPEILDYDIDFVELTWSRPETDGGTPITGYIVDKKEKDTVVWESLVVEVQGDNPAVKIKNLIEGKVYEFRVKAVNKVGPGEPSDATTSPRTARAKNHVLQWTSPKGDGGSGVTKYFIEKTHEFGIWEKAAEVPGNKTTAIVSGFREREEYKFCVVAVYKTGASFFVPHIDKTDLKDKYVPAGQRISFTVPYNCSKKPIVSWTVNGKPVHPLDLAGNRVHMSTSDKQIIFEIPIALRTDTGKYTLTLNDEMRSVSASATVTVTVRDIAVPDRLACIHDFSHCDPQQDVPTLLTDDLIPSVVTPPIGIMTLELKEKPDLELFSQQSKEKECDLELFSQQVGKRVWKKDRMRVTIEPSYKIVEDLVFGRMSFGGMNPEVEKLMKKMTKQRKQKKRSYFKFPFFKRL